MSGIKAFASFSAFTCGAVFAFVVLVSRQDLAAAPAITVHTCAAADGTLRLTEESVPCGPEERRVRIRVPGTKDPDCNEDNELVQKLERRLKDLEYRDRIGTLRGRRVVAPFEVVTKKEGRLMRIEEQNVTFYNHDGKPVVWIEADTSGGLLQTQSASGDREVSIAAQDRRAHLVIKEKGADRIDLGRRANGRYSVQVYGPQNKQVIGLGQSEAGSGLMSIGDAAGTTKVTMYISTNTDEGTHLDVMNQAGAVAGVMSTGPSAGRLQITDSSGLAKVEAGLTTGGVGVVRTFPGNCHFGIGILGLVPDCIVGKP
jgi:hypothetical protein